MTLEWKKIASVSTGGKPFFYIARPIMNGQARKYLVVWNRHICKWVASFDDMQTCVVPEEYGEFNTFKDAQDQLETDYQEYLTQEEVKK